MSMENLQALLQAQAGLAAGAQAKPLLEFKAGLMELKGTELQSDKRRGRVVIFADDSLGAPMLKLQWQIRPGNVTDFQLLLMEKSATLTKIDGCKDGRVWLLKYEGGRRFFWLQEPKADGDEEILKKFAELINKVPQRDPNEALAAQLSTMSDDEIPAALQQFQASQTHTTATGQAPRVATSSSSSSQSSSSSTSSIAPAAAAARPAGGAVSADSMALFTQLAQAFASQRGGAGAGGALLQQQRAQFEAQQQHSLNEILDADRVVPLLQADDSAIESLLQHLPEGARTRAELWATLRSPQLHQTIGRINQILNSSQFGQLMASFSLPLGGSIGVPGFIEAIQRTAGNNSATASQSQSQSSSTPANTESTSASKPAGSK